MMKPFPLSLCRLLATVFGLLLITAPLARADQAEPPSATPATFETALDAYQKGAYPAARQQWEALITQGEGNAIIYYNLGNTWARLGDSAQAILAYERALALSPRLPEAVANLTRVRNETGARLPELPLWQRAVHLPLQWSGNWAHWIAAGLFWVGAFCLLRRRNLPGLLCLFAFGWFAGAIAWESARPPLWIITGKNATARAAPADNSKRVATLPSGTQVRVVLQRGQWLYVRLPDQSRAWLQETMASPVVPAPVAQG